MNETNNFNTPNNSYNPANESDVPWTTSESQQPAPYPSVPSDSEKPATAAFGLLKDAEQGAHDTIDRLAERAEPAVRQMGESVAAAGETLHAKANQLRETRDEWAEGARSTVRSNPLASVAAALALGAVIARITR